MNPARSFLTSSLAFLLSLTVTVSPMVSAAEDDPPSRRSSAVDESPTSYAMLGDLLVARPLGLVVTAGGTIVFAASLPFTLLGGNIGETAEQLVLGPAKTTFLRCLGCKAARVETRDSSQRRVADPY